MGTLSATNYSFNFTNGTLTVSQAVLTVTANNTNRAYGLANPAFTASYTGFVSGDTTNVLSGGPSLITTATTNSPVGNYTITAALGTLSATNYSFNFVNGTMAVGSTILTVTVNNLSRVYGATNPALTVNYAGFINGDSTNVLTGAPALTTGATTNSPVGVYVITNGPGNLSAANYSFNFVNGALTVTQAVLTVTANNVTRMYGSTNPVLTVSYTGFINGDATNALTGAPVLATSAATNSPVGGYVITNSPGNLSAVNYNFTFVNGSLTVTQAVLVVSANNTNRIYGATNPVFTASYTGFFNGDSPGVLTGSPTLTTIAVTNSPVGIYLITATNGTLAATNYSFSLANGILTVSNAALTITASNQSKIYGQTTGVCRDGIHIGGLLNGDTVSSASLSSAGSPATATVAGSPYSIVVTNAVGIGLTNYTISYVNGSMTVGKATVTVRRTTRTGSMARRIRCSRRVMADL